MKGLSLLLVFAIAQLAWAGQVPDAINGTWVVKEYRFAGTSALSEKEAKAWIGRTLKIGTVCQSLEGERISSPKVEYAIHNAQTYFEEGFHIEPSEAGYKEPKVHEYQVQQADGRDWIAPGSTLLVISNTEALTFWDGVFFVLVRKQNFASQP
jgi:hypothetical protein